MREIRATNQEAHYLEGLNAVIDAEERETTKGELANGLLVNSAFAILRLGIATTLSRALRWSPPARSTFW